MLDSPNGALLLPWLANNRTSLFNLNISCSRGKYDQITADTLYILLSEVEAA